MLPLGVCGGKYKTDCGGEFPTGWFACAKLCADRHDPRARRVASRMVSVVLPVSPRPEDTRRRAADSAMTGDRAARRVHPEALPKRRRRLPTPAAASRAAAYDSRKGCRRQHSLFRMILPATLSRGRDCRPLPSAGTLHGRASEPALADGAGGSRSVQCGSCVGNRRR
jgi:hypothetical protein